MELAVGQPRRYGAGDPLVLARLFALLRELAWSVHRPEQRDAVADQLTRLRATSAGQDFDQTRADRLAALGRDVGDALAGRWAVRNREPIRVIRP